MFNALYTILKELQTTRKIPSVDDMKEGKIHKELNKTRNILPGKYANSYFRRLFDSVTQILYIYYKTNYTSETKILH